MLPNSEAHERGHLDYAPCVLLRPHAESRLFTHARHAPVGPTQIHLNPNAPPRPRSPVATLLRSPRASSRGHAPARYLGPAPALLGPTHFPARPSSGRPSARQSHAPRRAAPTRSLYVIELRPRPLLLRHLRPYATPCLRLSIGVPGRESFRVPVISLGRSRSTDSTSLLRAHVPAFNSGNSSA